MLTKITGFKNRCSWENSRKPETRWLKEETRRIFATPGDKRQQKEYNRSTCKNRNKILVQ